MKIIIEVDERKLEQISRDINPVNSDAALYYTAEPYNYEAILTPHYDEGLWEEMVEQQKTYGGDLPRSIICHSCVKDVKVEAERLNPFCTPAEAIDREARAYFKASPRERLRMQYEGMEFDEHEYKRRLKELEFEEEYGERMWKK